MFGAGTIGAVKLGLPNATGNLVVNSVLAAGLVTGVDEDPRGGDDSIFGANPADRILNAIAKVTITGQMDASSYFVCGKFKAVPKVGGSPIDLAADTRFKLG